MLRKRDERKQDAQYDERQGEFSEFVADEKKVIGKILHGLSRIMHEKAGYEEERPHVEGINPCLQFFIPGRGECYAAMA